MNVIQQILGFIKQAFYKKGKPAEVATNPHQNLKEKAPKKSLLKGGVLPKLIQKKLTAKRPKIELAGVCVERNYWAVATIVLACTLLVTTIALYHQTNRYENNMRTLMVKLYPNGTYDVNRVNFTGMPTYFLTTVNSLIGNFVKRRFAKHADSIVADYGYAYQFMSPKLRNQFMTETHASSLAHDFAACTDCNDVSVKVGVIQHYEADAAIIHAKPDHEYRSTVFATFITRSPDGTLMGREKKIITLVWRLRGLRDLNNHESSVRADPIGLVIMRTSIKADPTATSNSKEEN